MPRFFFRLVEDDEVYFDSDGQDMADEDTARKEAAIALTEVARDVVAEDGLHHEFEIVILDEKRRPIWRTTLDYDATQIS